MLQTVKNMDVRRYVLVAAVLALIPFALLKAFWPMASSSHKQAVSPVPVDPVDSATASKANASNPNVASALPASFEDILAYLNQHKALAKMTDAKDVNLPDIAKHGHNQISFTYTDNQLNDFQYADGNNTANYVSRHFQDIICNTYTPEIRQIFVQKYISFRLILQNRNQFVLLSEAFNPQHCPAAPAQE
ncbi:hypothetical protein [Alkanindiges illinoisensis]|uniref:hypothetical protein n=1 Tax=Alkanindiges illinoisensis TaxID=197183 RepID=UPI00047C0A42|nr:hypothetical protein [Alkanindiges illinoisensis]